MDFPNKKKPDFIIEDKSEAGFYSDVMFFQAPQEDLDIVSTNLTKVLMQELKNKILSDIPALLTASNFVGEAEDYMFKNKIPYSKKVAAQYAIALHRDFIDNLDKTIVFDESTGLIKISPYIYSLEYGDFYRPAVGFISNCIKEWLNDLNRKV